MKLLTVTGKFFRRVIHSDNYNGPDRRIGNGEELKTYIGPDRRKPDVDEAIKRVNDTLTDFSETVRRVNKHAK